MFKAFAIMTVAYTASLHASESLSLRDYLHKVESNDPNFKAILKQNDQIEYIVDLGLPATGLNLTLRAERGLDLEGSEHTNLASAGVSKEFIESGTTVSITHSNTIRPDREENVSELRIQQDLFKNLFGRDVRLKKTILEKQGQKIKMQVMESYEDYLLEVISLYLDFKKSYLDVKVSEEALADAKKLRAEVKERLDKRIANQADLDRSDLQVLIQEDNLRSKKLEFARQVQKIQTRTGMNKEMIPLAAAKWQVPAKNLELPDPNKLRIIAIDANQKEQFSNEQLLAARATQPDLSFIAGYAQDESQRFSSTVNRKEAVVGLLLSMPIGDAQLSAERHQAKYQYELSELTQAVNLQSINEQARLLITALKDRENVLATALKKIDLSERILKDDERRYGYGRIDLDRLISTRSANIQYQFDHQTALLDYNLAVLNWLSFTDQLVEFKEKLN